MIIESGHCAPEEVATEYAPVILDSIMGNCPVTVESQSTPPAALPEIRL